MTPDEWGRIADQMSLAWPKEALSPQQRELYFEVLKDLDVDAVADAVVWLIRDGCEEMPSPGLVHRRAISPDKRPGDPQEGSSAEGPHSPPPPPTVAPSASTNSAADGAVQQRAGQPSVGAKPKDAGVAVLLNFLWTGAGYFYVDSEKYMARGIICCVVTLFFLFANFLILPIFIWLPYWIWGMVDAKKVTDEYNRRLGAADY